MKKLSYYLIGFGLLSIMPVLILFGINYFKQKILSYNLERNIDYAIKSMRPVDVKYNSYYIAGKLGDDIYLGNSTSPLHLLKINSLSMSAQPLSIKVKEADFKTKGSYRTVIDSPYFYMSNGIERSILTGSTEDWLAHHFPIFTPYFTAHAPLGADSFFFRIISNKTGNNSLRKESRFSTTIENETVLQKQVDGLFCTDGILEYSPHLKKLIYVYYYRNQILLLDTNLNLIRKIKTIDPIEKAQLKISQIKSRHSVTFSAPPLLVNAKCSSWEKYLFIQSKLMGKHEDETLFNNSTVIDIYDLTIGAYVNSIYLPNYNHKPIRQFKVDGEFIYASSDHYLIKYRINLPKLK